MRRGCSRHSGLPIGGRTLTVGAGQINETK